MKSGISTKTMEKQNKLAKATYFRTRFKNLIEFCTLVADM